VVVVVVVVVVFLERSHPGPIPSQLLRYQHPNFQSPLQQL